MERLSDIPPLQSGSQGSAEDETKRIQEDQMKRDLMATVLDTAARERLSRIALVSPNRSEQIEGIILRMVRSGQLRGRVTEHQLIELLEQMEVQGKTSTKKSNIVYQRRKDLDDDDFDV